MLQWFRERRRQKRENHLRGLCASYGHDVDRWVVARLLAFTDNGPEQIHVTCARCGERMTAAEFNRAEAERLAA